MIMAYEFNNCSLVFLKYHSRSVNIHLEENRLWLKSSKNVQTVSVKDNNNVPLDQLNLQTTIVTSRFSKNIISPLTKFERSLPLNQLASLHCFCICIVIKSNVVWIYNCRFAMGGAHIDGNGIDWSNLSLSIKLLLCSLLGI